MNPITSKEPQKPKFKPQFRHTSKTPINASSVIEGCLGYLGASERTTKGIERLKQSLDLADVDLKV